MKVTKKDIENVAVLSRLSIPEEDQEQTIQDLDEILTSFDYHNIIEITETSYCFHTYSEYVTTNTSTNVNFFDPIITHEIFNYIDHLMYINYHFLTSNIMK